MHSSTILSSCLTVLLDSKLIHSWLTCIGGVLGIYYAHAYAHISKVANTNLPLTLKGSDLVLYSVLHALGATVSIQPVLEVDKGDYNWGHGLETEDGELVGEQLHPYHQSSSSTEYDPLDQVSVPCYYTAHPLSYTRSHMALRLFATNGLTAK